MKNIQKKILIVDDETTNLHFLNAILGNDYELHLAKNSAEAFKYAESAQHDLILLDIHMPDKDGFEVAQHLTSELKVKAPIIFVSSSHDKDLVEKALKAGAYDYIVKPFEPHTIHTKVKKIFLKNSYIELKKIYLQGIKLMDSFFEKGITSLSKQEVYNWAETLVSQIEKSKFSIGKLVSVFQDNYTEASHNINVSVLAVSLGKQLQLKHTQLLDIAIAACLHDIGKYTIADEIRNKPSMLTREEEEIVQTHSIESVALTKELGIHKTEILHAIEYHHEKLDGTGYPHYLTGTQIPAYAQIISICDIFDALTSQKTYRKKYSSFDALMLMKKEMSSQINENYVNHLITLLR